MCVVRRLGVKEKVELRSPINQQSFAYWQSKRMGRAMPCRNDFDPSEMVGFLPYVFLLDVRHDPIDFRYRLIGTYIDERMRARYAGLWMSQIPHQRPPSIIFSSCEQVVKMKQPYSSETPYVGKHKEFKSTEDIIMPLSDDNNRVDRLFVTAAFI